MIYVPEERLEQVEYLIRLSLQGNHVLFDDITLKRVLASRDPLAPPLADDEAYSAEPHIERVLEQPTFEAKRAYLEALDHETLEKVVRAYFNIVENSLFEEISERSLREGEVRH